MLHCTNLFIFSDFQETKERAAEEIRLARTMKREHLTDFLVLRVASVWGNAENQLNPTEIYLDTVNCNGVPHSDRVNAQNFIQRIDTNEV